MATTHKERQELIEKIETLNMLEVAETLGMTLNREGTTYTWADHDSLVITPRKNMFYWNSMQKGGGNIQLVQAVKECSYPEAIQFLTSQEIKNFEPPKDIQRKFNYFVQEQNELSPTYEYLMKERQLSKETVDFFVSEGVIAQTTYKKPKSTHEETAIVFKHKSPSEKIEGMSYQGTQPYPEVHPKKGYLKRTMGDGYVGFNVIVGTPPTRENLSNEHPLHIIAFESPIDLMSYYELNKDNIGDAVLLSMNGLRKQTISNYIANHLQSTIPQEEKIGLLDTLNNRSSGKIESIKITLAVDHDTAGLHFIDTFKMKNIDINSDVPPLKKPDQKADWNEHLKQRKLNLESEKSMPATRSLQKKKETDLNQIINAKNFKALSEHLQDGVSDYLDSDTFKNYLTFISKFHKYSPKNIQLIHAQMKRATRVAGFNFWKKQERFVKKGQQALYIYSPAYKNKKDENGHLVKDEKGNIEKETYFRLVPVFDISQTDGKEVPQQIYNLEDELQDTPTFINTFKTLEELSPVPIEIDDINQGNGYYDLQKKEIVLNKNMGEAMTIKVLLHEITHALMHSNSTAKFGDNNYSVQEFEAESVAYIVSNHLGIDTENYSFAYISSWTNEGKTIEELTESLEKITLQAKELINKIDTTLGRTHDLQQPKNKFEERLHEANLKQNTPKREPKEVKKTVAKNEETEKNATEKTRFSN